jgi:hypothetical protein
MPVAAGNEFEGGRPGGGRPDPPQGHSPSPNQSAWRHSHVHAIGTKAPLLSQATSGHRPAVSSSALPVSQPGRSARLLAWQQRRPSGGRGSSAAAARHVPALHCTGRRQIQEKAPRAQPWLGQRPGWPRSGPMSLPEGGPPAGDRRLAGLGAASALRRHPHTKVLQACGPQVRGLRRYRARPVAESACAGRSVGRDGAGRVVTDEAAQLEVVGADDPVDVLILVGAFLGGGLHVDALGREGGVEGVSRVGREFRARQEGHGAHASWVCVRCQGRRAGLPHCSTASGLSPGLPSLGRRAHTHLEVP